MRTLTRVRDDGSLETLQLFPERWHAALELALRVGGWRPRGCEPPPIAVQRERAGMEEHEPDSELPPFCRSDYTSSDERRVTHEDAVALGLAIVDAMDDVPRSRTEKVVLGSREGLVRVPKNAANVLEALAGPEGRDTLLAIAKFCRGGGFEIR